MSFLDTGVPGWTARAACALSPGGMTAPEITNPDEAARFIASYCDACPVIERCDRSRASMSSPHGVWAGQLFLGSHTAKRLPVMVTA